MVCYAQDSCAYEAKSLDCPDFFNFFGNLPTSLLSSIIFETLHSIQESSRQSVNSPNCFENLQLSINFPDYPEMFKNFVRRLLFCYISKLIFLHLKNTKIRMGKFFLGSNANLLPTEEEKKVFLVGFFSSYWCYNPHTSRGWVPRGLIFKIQYKLQNASFRPWSSP